MTLCTLKNGLKAFSLVVFKLVERMEVSKMPRLLFLSNVFFLVNCKLIDMSFPYKNDSVTLPGIKPFSISLAPRGPYLGAPFVITYDIHMNENTGTHMDAPIHFFKGKTSVDEIPPKDLIAEAIVVDITEQTSKNRDYALTVDDLKDWEKKYGVIPDGSVVFILTGLGKHWENYEKYMGRKENSSGSFHWPGMSFN